MATKGTVSQIFYLHLSFLVYLQRGVTFGYFLKLNVLNLIEISHSPEMALQEVDHCIMFSIIQSMNYRPDCTW